MGVAQLGGIPTDVVPPSPFFPGYDYMESIDMNSYGLLIVSGGFGTDIDLGLGPMNSEGGNDIYAAGFYW